MFELIHPGTNFDFVGYRFYAVTASIVVISLGVVSLCSSAASNYGIDFAGGTLVQVRFHQAGADQRHSRRRSRASRRGRHRAGLRRRQRQRVPHPRAASRIPS